MKRYRGVLNASLALVSLYYPHLQLLSEVTQVHIEQFQRRRLESVELKIAADGEKPGNHGRKILPRPQTVNYEVSVLKSAFNWALDRDWVSRNPVIKVNKLRITDKKTARLLSAEECSRLLHSADGLASLDSRFSIYAGAIRFLLNTGLRSGELCNLMWNDVDERGGLIRLQPKPGWTPKSYAREFFLNPASLAVLGEVGEKEGYVFVSESGSRLRTDALRGALIRAAKRAGIEGLTRVHDLRHTFNILMQMNGVDAPTMAKILGHQDLSTTMIYTHQSQEHLKKSIEKVGIR